MKIKNEVGNKIKERIRLLESHVGFEKSKSDLLYPAKQRDLDRKAANEYADQLQDKINVLEPLVKALKFHIHYIGDQDKYVATYLLIGKSFTTLKSLNHLMRLGFSFQIVELVRSSLESLSLTALFLEDGQENLLDRWFKGEIIDNNTARSAIDISVNKIMKEGGKELVPMKEALSDIYSVYSSYTHSGYGALFDFVDIFNEDFDFDQSAQLHYNREYLELVDNLYVNILLSLKNFYIKKHDEENLAKVEILLSKEVEFFARETEIDREFERYNRKT